MARAVALLTLFLIAAAFSAKLVNGQAPQLVVVPESRSVPYLSNIRLTCVAVNGGGSAPNITWTLNGQTISNEFPYVITTATSSVGTNQFPLYHSYLDVCKVGMDQAGMYSCIAANSGGNDVSTWSVDIIPTPITALGVDPPDLALVPQNLYVPYGSTVTMTCVGFDDDDRADMIWMLNGDPLDSTMDDINIDTTLHSHGGNHFVISILTVCSIEDDDLGLFACMAATSGGNRTATWTLSAYVDYRQIIRNNEYGVPPVIVIAPGASSVLTNDTVAMTCVAYGGPTPTITWSQNGGRNLTNEMSSVQIFEEQLNVGGKIFIQSTLQLCGIALGDFVDYSCMASNAAGNDTYTFSFTYAELVLSPTNLYADLGSDVTMTCVARGIPTPAISWSLNGQDVDSSTADSLTVNSRMISQGNEDFTVSLLRVCGVDQDVTGEYSCVANNMDSTGRDEFFWTLTGRIGVNASTAGKSPRVVVSSDTTSQVSLNSTALITCIAYGDPVPTITWTKDSMQLMNTTESDDGVIIYNTVESQGDLVFARSVLQVCFVDDDETGVYSCVATSSLGRATQDITLTYTEIVASPDDSVAYRGGTVTMSCIAIGTPLPQINWMRNGETLSDATDSVSISNRMVTQEGLDFAVSLLTVCSVDYDDVGMYSCEATNSAGGRDLLSWRLRLSSEKPVITVVPTDSLVKLENEVILTCVAYGTPLPSVTWWKDGNTVTNSTTASTITVYESTMNINNTDEVVAGTRLEICSFGLDDIGNYQCIAENSVGSHISAFRVDLDPFRTEVEIVLITNNPTVHESSSAVISCVAYSMPGPPTVQWMRNGGIITNSSELTIYERSLTEGGRDFVYTYIEFCSLQMEDAGNYTCVANNGYRIESFATELTVLPGEAPSIVISPNRTTFTVQERSIAFTCAAYGTPLPMEIQWYREGNLVPSSAHDNITQELVFIDGKYLIRSILQICNVGAADQGNYSCHVNNGFGNDTQYFDIEISFAEIVLSPPALAEYDEGYAYQFTCVAYGQPQPDTVTWYYQPQGGVRSRLINGALGNRVTLYDSETVQEGGSTFVVTVMQFCNVMTTDTGMFTCEAGHDVHSDSQSFGLTVVQPGYGPFIVVRPTNYTFVNGSETYSFVCVATGDQTPTISWSYGSQPLSNSSVYTIYQEQFTEGNFTFTQSILQICSVTYANRGIYTCTARNQRVGDDTATFEIAVDGALALVDPVNDKIDVLALSDTRLEFVVPPIDPPPTDMRWYLTPDYGTNPGVEILITPTTNPRYTLSSDMLSLSITSASLEDQGIYRLAVQNLVGVSNGYINLAVYVEPQIVTEGVVTTGIMGQSTTLSCAADGVPTPIIYWLKGGQIILPNEGDKYGITDSLTTPGQRAYITETRTSSLTISSLDAQDAGMFTCVADNNIGRNGVQTVSYQLQVQSTNVDFCSDPSVCMNGGTCTSASRSYVCECQDGYNGGNCETAVPSIDIMPMITQAPQPTFVNHYDSVNLTCLVRGVPQPSVQWYKDGQMIPGENLQYLYIGSVDVWTRGSYNCTATNRAGMDSRIAVVNLNDAIQYTVTLMIPRTSSIFDGVSGTTAINARVTQFVNDLNTQVTGTLLDFNNGMSHAVVSGISLPGGGPPNYNTATGALSVIVSYIIVDAAAGSDKASIATEVQSQLSGLLVPAAQILDVTLTISSTVTRFDGCRTDSTTFTPYSGADPATISWSAIDIGTMAEATCPCTDVGCENSPTRTAVRWCRGDFVNGAMWVNADISDCMFVVGMISSVQGGIAGVLTGESTTVSFSITGSYPSITSNELLWTFTNGAGQVVPISTGVKYRISQDRLSLTINNAMLTDAGTYSVTATNVAGSASGTVDLTVIVPPVIQGKGGIAYTQDSGTEARFSCSSDGIPTPNILWLKNGQLLQTGFSERFALQESVGQTQQERNGISESRTSMLVIREVTPRDDGRYQCQAINQFGNSATLAQAYNLTVNPPAPIDYCESVTCQNGGTCTNGRSSYTCSCVSGFNGLNCENAVAAESAPTISQGPQDTVVDLYDEVSLVCMASGNPQPTIQWFKDGQMIMEENSQTLTISSIDLPDRGLYSCTATNTQGSATSERAVVNIRGIQQYLMAVYVPSTSQPFTGVDLAQSSQLREAELLFLLEMNARVAGAMIGSGAQGASIQISSVQNQQVTVTSYNPATGQLKVTLLLTLFVTGYDYSQGGSPVTSGSLTEITQVLGAAASDINTIGAMIPASEIQRFDGCSSQSDTFVAGGQSRGTLDWPETSIGWTAVAPCPCDQQALRRLGASRKCAGDFLTGGSWAPFDPLQAPCSNFNDLTWSICSTPDLGGVLSLTNNGSRIGSLEVALTTDLVEQMLPSATGDRPTTAMLLSLIDNVLQAPQGELANSTRSFNTTGRLIAALNWLVDSLPASNLDNPEIITFDTYGIIIYSSVTPSSFSGHTVAALLGESFQFTDFTTDDIIVGGSGYSETPTAEIQTTSSLFSGLNVTAPAKVIYNVFLNDTLFTRRQTQPNVTSIVVAARIAGLGASNLASPVQTVFLKNMTDGESQKAQCVFWDQQLDGGYGAWSAEGCSVVRDSRDQATCECNRLSSYAVVADAAGGTFGSDETIGPYTVVGIVVLFVCALLVLVSYIVSRQRFTPIGITLINLCIGLILLCLSYVISEYLRARVDANACYAFSAFFHYMILVNALSILIVAMFMVYIPYTTRAKKIAYFTALLINWLLPFVIVILSLAPNYQNYYNEEFCRPVSLSYWIGLLLPGCIIGVIIVVLLVVIPIKRKADPAVKIGDQVSWRRDYVGLILVAVFYYIAWGFGLPQTNTLGLGALRVIFQLIFVVATGLLGLSLVFVLCFFSADIRHSWRQIFCFYLFDKTDKKDKKFLINPEAKPAKGGLGAPFEAEYENPVAEESTLADLQPPGEDDEEEKEEPGLTDI